MAEPAGDVIGPLLLQRERLSARLRELPAEPGCYLMRDASDRILYIGKSKSLRARVRSYFRSSHDISPRIALMVRQVCEIEFIVTDSEAEALALESNLIKNHQPHFNVLLKDDKKYPYLCITWSEAYPRIFITRRRRLRSPLDRFYGPYVDVGLLRRTLAVVKRVFPLRQRPQPLYRDRTCLNFDIGRCPGVCQEKIGSDDYHHILRKVAMVFQGRNDELLDLLRQQMERYAERLDFEAAARVRDQLQGLDLLTADQKMSLGDSSVSRDVIALAADDRVAAVQIFQMRAGKLVGRLGYTADAAIATPAEVLQRVVEEHYSQVEPVEIPPELVLQHALPAQELIREWLAERRGRKVRLVVPQRRQKADLIELVERNAGFELARAQRGRSNSCWPPRTWPSCWSWRCRPGGSRAMTSATSRAATPWPPRWCSSTGCRPSSTTANTGSAATASTPAIPTTSWPWRRSCGGASAAGRRPRPRGPIWPPCAVPVPRPFTPTASATGRTW